MDFPAGRTSGRARGQARHHGQSRPGAGREPPGRRGADCHHADAGREGLATTFGVRGDQAE
ncbi:hypothetical protein ACFTZI_12345 [Streptomyces decoyicus]|uniref:hypothetical protein n=1 Tax=Streptomyces decoyicus TaxID=249567 RepID=UPI003633676A